MSEDEMPTTSISKGKSQKRSGLGLRILKYFLLGMGSIVLLLLALVSWIYISLIAGPDLMEMSDFHPFKSSSAKTRYLAFEDQMAKKWPIVSEEKTVRTSYGLTFLRISGPVNGQPLVLLPGGGTNSLIWQANIEALSTVYRTYALDNIADFGRSVFTRKIETADDYSQWLDELFNTLDLGSNIRLMGYSYGGWITSQYAIRHSDRLSKVVLVAPAFTVLPVSGGFMFRMLIGILPSKALIRSTIYWVWDDLVKSGPAGKAIADERVEFLSIAYKSFKFKAGVNPIVLDNSDLKKLKMPVLFLMGENEKICDPHQAIDRLKKVVPGVQTQLFNGTGHDLLFTHADKMNVLVLEFLKE
jgi:pimeloyl-ACP methyl ester carboxylesterase